MSDSAVFLSDLQEVPRGHSKKTLTLLLFCSGFLLALLVRGSSIGRLSSQGIDYSNLDATTFGQRVGFHYSASSLAGNQAHLRGGRKPAFSMESRMFPYGRGLGQSPGVRDVSVYAGEGRIKQRNKVNKKKEAREQAKEAEKSYNQDPNGDVIEMAGVIGEVLPNCMYRVNLENGMEILGHLSGKMRQRSIWVTLGDPVKIEISKYDLTRGRIVYRERLPDKTPAA